MSLRERKSKEQKEIQDENISIPRHDECVFVIGSNRKQCLWYGVQNVQVTNQKFRDVYNRLSTLSLKIRRWLLLQLLVLVWNHPPWVLINTSSSVKSFFIFKRRLAAEEGSFSKKTWVQKISRGWWALLGPVVGNGTEEAVKRLKWFWIYLFSLVNIFGSPTQNFLINFVMSLFVSDPEILLLLLLLRDVVRN